MIFLPGNDAKGPLDIIIEHCNLYNGDKSVTYNVNIGVQNGKIAYIGQDKLAAKEVIDARGLVTCPGFVDVHNHTDEELIESFGQQMSREQLDLNDLRCHNFTAQGVTTIITGNCGNGFSSISLWQGLIGNSGYGVNVGHLIPYSSIRSELFGEQDAKGKLDNGDIKKMGHKIGHEMDKGALGFSVAFDHVPGCHATTAELTYYARIVAKFNGIFVIHIRNESGVGISAAIAEAIKIGAQSGVKVHLSQFRIYNPLLDVTPQKICALIEDARVKGVNITVSQNPYHSVCSSFAQYFVNHLLSNIAPELILKDGFIEKDLVNAFQKIADDYRPETMLIVSCAANKDYEGKTMVEISEREGKDLIKVMQELYNMSPSPFAVAFVIPENVINELMDHDYVFTSSNGALCVHNNSKKHHPRSFGTFPKKLRLFLDHPNRDLSNAIYSMTAGPAEFFNLKKRGIIKEGYAADIVLFDTTTIGHHEDYCSNENQYATGVKYVIVNGIIEYSGSGFSKNYGGEIILNQ